MTFFCTIFFADFLKQFCEFDSTFFTDLVSVVVVDQEAEGGGGEGGAGEGGEGQEGAQVHGMR